MAPVRVNLATASLDCVRGHLLELGHQVLDDVALHVNGVEVLLELGV
jgi:hypothetical protein